jgi:septal ring factor EnvC (AmiA/AmiB activator)
VDSSGPDPASPRSPLRTLASSNVQRGRLSTGTLEEAVNSNDSGIRQRDFESNDLQQKNFESWQIDKALFQLELETSYRSCARLREQLADVPTEIESPQARLQESVGTLAELQQQFAPSQSETASLVADLELANASLQKEVGSSQRDDA